MTTLAPADDGHPTPLIHTHDVTGAQLCPGDILVEHLPGGTVVLHLIDHLTEYPARFVGRTEQTCHARRAYTADGAWRCTVGDGEPFHVLGD